MKIQCHLFGNILEECDQAGRTALQHLHEVQKLDTLELQDRFTSLEKVEFIRLLLKLERKGLILNEGWGWRCSWLGVGVVNWHEQLKSFQMMPGPSRVLPLLRRGENGEQLGPPCQEFRSAFYRPGYCWCGRHRILHRVVS